MNHVEQTHEWYKSFQNFLLSKEQYHPLIKILDVDPNRVEDINYMRERHYHASMACFSMPPLTALMLKAIDQFNHVNLGLPSFERLFEPKVREYYTALNKKGFVDLPPIEQNVIEEMRNYFSSQKVLTPTQELVPFSEFNHANVAEFPIETILKCPHLLKIASDPDVLALVERYLGTIPTAIVAAAWWSIGGKEAPKEAQLFHYDYDDYKFCKLFLYLTDVDMDAGPHVYVEGTHNFDRVLQARSEWPEETDVFDKFYISTLRKSDADVEKYFKTEPRYFTGAAGSRFIVDTRGIHKGLLPKAKNRLICQITFGVSPFFQQQIRSIPVTDLPQVEQDRVTKTPYRHVFRLFFSQDKSNTPQKMVENPIALTSETIVLDKIDEWKSVKIAKFYIENIWGNRNFIETISDWIFQSLPKVSSLLEIRTLSYAAFNDPEKYKLPLTAVQIQQAHQDLTQYDKMAISSLSAYSLEGKSNPEAVFWPNPSRPGGKSVFETLPMVKKNPIVTKDTPIGSAGSCFAFEISYQLQKNGFNYIVTEKSHRPKDGIYCDGSEENPHLEQFSSAWGILFNTPSFRQIAEHSFGIKKLPKILIKKSEEDVDLFIDPFRENVFFASEDAFENDYQKHLEASREALTKCKVFVLTLGLNECWQLNGSGAVISRNPHSLALGALLKHKTLSVDENIENIESFLHTVRRFNPDFKLILSVSPIPFLATGRAEEHHVITANGHSKAVLRVAAEEVVKRNPGVFYFPSYELVTTCTKNPWDIDERHVTRETVSRVMKLFDEMFVA